MSHEDHHEDCTAPSDHDGACSTTDENGETHVHFPPPESIEIMLDSNGSETHEAAEQSAQEPAPMPTAEEVLRAENASLREMNDNLTRINAALHVKLAAANAAPDTAR